MKKALVVLLSLVAAGALFAADAPTFVTSGYVNSGLKIVNTSDGTTYQSYGDDWGAGGTSATIGVTYTSAMSGFEVVLYGNSDGTVSLDTGYGWVSPMTGFKLFAGTTYSGAFDGVDDDSNDYFSSNGLSATYAISGLTVGAGIVATTPATSLANDSPTGFVLGAAYAMDGMFKFRFSAQTLEDELNKMAASVSVLAVPGLTLSAGYLSESMATTSNDWLDATVGYAISPALSAKVVVYDYLTKEYLSIAPRVTFVVNPALTVYGQLAYLTEGKDAAANYETMKPRVNATYKFDANAKFYGQIEYDTDAEKATVLLQYVFSF